VSGKMTGHLLAFMEDCFCAQSFMQIGKKCPSRSCVGRPCHFVSFLKLFDRTRVLLEINILKIKFVVELNCALTC
jgi:hypothetical protein